MMKPTPAKTFNTDGLRYLPRKFAPKTANPEDSTRAVAEPRNTLKAAPFLVEAKRKVATWVLSPSSETKTVPRTVKKILKSNIFSPLFMDMVERVLILKNKQEVICLIKLAQQGPEARPEQ